MDTSCGCILILITTSNISIDIGCERRLVIEKCAKPKYMRVLAVLAGDFECNSADNWQNAGD